MHLKEEKGGKRRPEHRVRVTRPAEGSGRNDVRWGWLREAGEWGVS